MGRDDGDAYMIANAAMRAIEAHAKDCRDFRKEIKEAGQRAEAARELMRIDISKCFKDLYGFLWKIALSITATLFAMLVGLLIFVAQHAVVWNPSH